MVFNLIVEVWFTGSSVCVCVCVCVCVYSVTCRSLWPHRLQPTRLLCPWDFSRQEYWCGLPFPSSGDFPSPRLQPISPASPALAGGVDSLPLQHLGTLSSIPYPELIVSQTSISSILYYPTLQLKQTHLGNPSISKIILS